MLSCLKCISHKFGRKRRLPELLEILENCRAISDWPFKHEFSHKFGWLIDNLHTRLRVVLLNMADYKTCSDAVDQFKHRFGVETVKKEQLESLFNFVCKKDVFVNLPTGFGKSFIYQIAPMVIQQMGISSNPIIIVVSPLIALMNEEVRYLNSIGISATCLSNIDKSDQKLQSGDYMFVYTSPESLLSDSERRELLSSRVYKDRIFGIVVDEAHCISHW